MSIVKTGRRALTTVLGLALTVSALTLWPQRADAAAPPPEDNPATAVTADVLPTAQINGVAWDQVVVGDTVYVAGEFTAARPAGSPAGQDESPRSNLMAYNLTTGVMTAWAPQVNGVVRTITASPDGSRIYVGGGFTSVNGAGRWRVAAFRTADGSLDPDFAPVAGSDVFAVAATSTQVYLGGWFTTVNNVPRSRLAAVGASDGVVLDWAPVADHTVRGLALTGAQDRVIAGGSFANLNGSPMRGLGSLDAVSGASYPFEAGQILTNAGNDDAMMSVKVADDKVFSTGYAYGIGNVEGVVVADAYTGTVTNLVDCHGDTYDSAPMNGVFYSVSHHHMCSNSGGYPEVSPRRWYHADAWTVEPRGTVNRNTQTGGHYVNWEGRPTGANVHWYNDWTPGSYTGIHQAGWTAESTGDYLVIGGEFPAVNGIAQQGLVRFGTRAVVPQPQVGPAGLRSESAPVLQTISARVHGNFKANYDRDSAVLSYKVVRTDKGEGAPVHTATVASNPWTRPTLSFIDPDVIPGWSYTYYVIATDADGNAKSSDPTTITVGTTADPYSSAVSADGAEHYWRLGQAPGAMVAPDLAGTRPLTLLSGATGGSPGALSGVADTSTTFSGTTSGTSGTAGATLPGPQVFSVEAWFRTSSTRGGKILGFGSSATGTSSANDRNLYLNDAGNLTFGVYDRTVRSVTSPRTYRDGNWHHAVATVSAEGTKLYVDGALVGSNAAATSAEARSGYWRVGGDRMAGWPNAGTSAYLAGAIDEVAIYPTALTAEQVAAHHTAGVSGGTNVLPTASFTDVVTDLDVAVDATASTDPDGTIVAYGWEFGDGGRALGPTATHQYGAPGTYTVKLTVVDDKGGVDTQTRAVEVSPDGQGDVIAKDTFNRAGSRWGTAAIGGGWTDSGSSFYSTDGARGVVTMSRGGQGPSAALPAVSARDVVIRTDVAVDAMPTGGVYLHQLSARTNGSDNYKLTARFELTGTLRLLLSKRVGATETTLRSYLLPGFTYAAGERINLRFLVQGSGTTVLEAKAWKAGQPEPAESQVRLTDTQAELQGAGALGITSYAGGSMTSLPFRATVDDYQVDAFNNAAPTADFEVAVDGLGIAVDASASSDADGTITDYAWDFGDGATGTGATATHTYAAGGTYPVTLTVTDDAMATTTYIRDVIVVKPNDVPVAVIAEPSTDELTVTLDGSGSTDADGTITAHLWDLGDGTEADSPQVTHTYAEAGTYEVTLLVTDDRGATATATRSVTVGPNQAPTASFTVARDDLAVRVSGAASTDPEGPLASYAWDFGDGTTATGVDASHTYAAAGTYTVSLTVTDGKGATATATQSVTVADADPSVVARDDFGRTASTWGTADLGGAWTTNVGSAFSTDGSHGRVVVPAGSTRTAKLGAVSERDVSVVTDVALAPAPAGGTYIHQVIARQQGTNQYALVARLETNGSLRLSLTRTLNGSEATLRSTVVSNFGYAAGERLHLRLDAVGTSLAGTLWRGDAPEPTTPTLTATDTTAALQAPGAVMLKLYAGSTVSNAPVAATVDAITVRSLATPNAEPTAAFTQTVKDLTVSVDGSGSSDADGSIAAHAWDFGDGATGSGATASHTYAAAGTYPVTLTVTDDRGASASSTRSVTVAAPAEAAMAHDTFTRTGSGWGQADVGGTWTTNTASPFATDGDHGTVVVPAGGTRAATLGEVQARDVSITTDLALDRAPAGGPFLHQVIGRAGGTNQYTLTTRVETNGALRLTLSRTVGGVETILRSTTLTGFGYTAGERLNVRLAIAGEGTTTLAGSVWRATEAEPENPTVTTTDATGELQVAGSAALKFYASGATSNGPLTASVDEYRIVEP